MLTGHLIPPARKSALEIMKTSTARSSYVMLPLLGTAFASLGNGGNRVSTLTEAGRSLTVRVRGLEIIADARAGAPAWLSWSMLIPVSLAMLMLWPEHWARKWRELSRDPEPVDGEETEAMPSAA